MKYQILIAALVLTGMSSIASAQGNSEAGRGERPNGPPPQAIAACKGKVSGDACTFQGRDNNSETGTCFAPSGENLPQACRPEHGGKNMGKNQSGKQDSNR